MSRLLVPGSYLSSTPSGPPHNHISLLPLTFIFFLYFYQLCLCFQTMCFISFENLGSKSKTCCEKKEIQKSYKRRAVRRRWAAGVSHSSQGMSLLIFTRTLLEKSLGRVHSPWTSCFCMWNFHQMYMINYKLVVFLPVITLSARSSVSVSYFEGV